MTARLAYTGLATMNGDDPQRLEIWTSDDHVAVAFAGGGQVGVLRDLTLDLTADRRLRLEGLNPNDEVTMWEAVDPERITTRWAGARISWPSGEVSTGATVTGSQHGVIVHHDGVTTELPAARLQAVGSQRWIIDANGTRILSSDGRGCGCGGSRRR